jgi:hypothetical protein
LCGTPLRLEGFKPGKSDEGAPVVDPLLDLFERDEDRADVPAVPRRTRDRIEGVSQLPHRPRADHPRGHGGFDSAEARRIAQPARDGPAPKVPADLVRIHVCAGPDEASRRLAAMKFLAIDVRMGSDSLDADPDPALIGMYVRRHDVTVARYILEGPDAVAEDPFARARSASCPTRVHASSRPPARISNSGSSGA